MVVRSTRETQQGWWRRVIRKDADGAFASGGMHGLRSNDVRLACDAGELKVWVWLTVQVKRFGSGLSHEWLPDMTVVEGDSHIDYHVPPICCRLSMSIGFE
jgi:hypothetical protein